MQKKKNQHKIGIKKERNEVTSTGNLQISTKDTCAIFNTGYNTFPVKKFTGLERHLDSNHGGA